MKESKYFSRLSVEKIMKKYGAGQVSVEAKIIVGRLLERYAMRLTRNCVKMALHAGRIRVREEDVRAVLKK